MQSTTTIMNSHCPYGLTANTIIGWAVLAHNVYQRTHGNFLPACYNCTKRENGCDLLLDNIMQRAAMLANRLNKGAN